MKKIIFTLCIAILVVTMSIGVFAADEYYRLQDIAELLTETENAEIMAKLDEVSEKHDMDIAILTVEAVDEGLTVSEDAMEWYEYLEFDTNGVMLYISMEERDWYLLTSGYGITAITDAGIEYISEKFLEYLSDGDYTGAFNTYIQLVDEFVTQAKTGSPYDVGNMPKEPYNFVMSLIISIIIGYVASRIINGKWKNTLNSVAHNTRAANYVKQGTFNVTASRDLFLYKTIDRKEKPKKDEGGSSTTKSSSGRSYGGGGGKF